MRSGFTGNLVLLRYDGFTIACSHWQAAKDKTPSAAGLELDVKKRAWRQDLLLRTLTSHDASRPTSVVSTITLHRLLSSLPTTLRRHGHNHVTSSMPRRKAADRDQPHKRRSRNGCLNCRRRKIRCDEGSPACGYCSARSLACSRGGLTLKWEAEYADNGRAFGRQGVSRLRTWLLRLRCRSAGPMLTRLTGMEQAWEAQIRDLSPG